MQRIAQARRWRARLSLRSTWVARNSGLPQPQIAFRSGTYIIRGLTGGLEASGGLLNPAESTRRRQVAGTNRGMPMQVEPPKHHFVRQHNVISSNSSNRSAMQSTNPSFFTRLGKVLLAALLSLQASYAAALGLGEIDLDSALNEKLRAEIGLIDASGLESSEILVSLASSEDFERVGVERFFFLTDLKFDVAVDSKGQPIIRVRSGQAISEPYLNFIVEVLWPSGRLLKEFTLLLDPPTFTQAAAPAVSAPARTTASVPPPRTTAPAPVRAPARTSTPSAPTRSAPRAAAPASAAPVAATGPGEVLTTRNDTLWNIAQKTLPATDISVEQNMLALKRKNPKAFIRDNVNLMKAGYVLRTPTTNEAQQLTTAEAKARVAAEHEAWRTGRNLPSSNSVAAQDDGSDLKAQVDATAAGSNTKPAATNEGQLRIVAGDGDSTQGAKDTAAAGTSLAASAEEQDRLAREVEELNYKLDREAELAANQLTVKERQLEVKDQEIAELQASVEALREQYQEAIANESNAAVPAEPLAWWQAPWVIASAFGGLVLLLGWSLFAARRKTEYVADDAYYEQDDVTASVAEPVVEAQDAVIAVTEPSLDEADVEDYAEEATDAFEDEHSVAELEPIGESSVDDDFDLAVDDDASDDLGQTSDVIGEADIYIAYGRYPQAISLLVGALEADPDRHDVRCKLLQLYSETNDADSFAEQMQELNNRCDDPDVLTVANELQVSLNNDELDLSADAGVDTSVDAEPTETEMLDELTDVDAGMDEFQLELDDDILGEDTDGELGAADLESLATEFDDMADPAPELDVADVAGEAAEDLGGDLGMDFDPEVDVVPELTDNSDDDVPQLDDSADADESSLADFSNTDLDDDEFDFNDSSDSASTKLDLARAYIDMGDQDGARDILGEVLVEGNDDQQRQANELLENI